MIATAPSEHRAFLAGAAGVGAVQAVGALLTVVTTVVLARVLGEEGFGAYVYTTTWVLLLTSPASLGIGPVVTREAARATTLGRREQLGALRAFAVRVTLVASAVVCGVGAIGLVLFPRAFDRPELMGLALPITVLSAILLVIRHWLLGLRRAVIAQLAESVLRPGLVLLGVGAASLAGVSIGATGALLAFGAATAAGVLLTGFLALRLAPDLGEGSAEPGWLRACGPLLVTAIARDLNAEASVLVLGSMLPAADVGLFRAASRLASIPSLVLQAMNLSLQPVAASLAATGELRELERIGVRASRVATILSLPVLVLFAFAGGPILTLFGPAFSAAAPALAVLSLGHLFNVVCGSVGVILVASHHERDVARGLLVSCAVSLAANVLLVPTWGLLGAAAASALALFVWNVLLSIAVWRRLGIVPAAVWSRR